jgi:hypothetical protein
MLVILSELVQAVVGLGQVFQCLAIFLSNTCMEHQKTAVVLMLLMGGVHFLFMITVIASQ